jgi:hypothetical protein
MRRRRELIVSIGPINIIAVAIFVFASVTAVIERMAAVTSGEAWRTGR